MQRRQRAECVRRNEPAGCDGTSGVLPEVLISILLLTPLGPMYHRNQTAGPAPGAGRSHMCTRFRTQILVSALVMLAVVFGLGEAQQRPAVDALPIYPDRGAAGLSRLLRELQTRASLLMFTAQP